MKKSSTVDLPSIAVCLLLVLPCLVYPTCYVFSGDYYPAKPGGPAYRQFRWKWQATAFIPAAKVESHFRGRIVAIGWYDPLQGIGGTL